MKNQQNTCDAYPKNEAQLCIISPIKKAAPKNRLVENLPHFRIKVYFIKSNLLAGRGFLDNKINFVFIVIPTGSMKFFPFDIQKPDCACSVSAINFKIFPMHPMKLIVLKI